MAKNIVSINLDGITYTGRPFGTCGTEGSIENKIVTCSDFSLTTGATILVKFSNSNTVSSPTLNVNLTGAKKIFYKGALLTNPLQYWEANDIIEFYYNGSAWEILGKLGIGEVNRLSGKINLTNLDEIKAAQTSLTETNKISYYLITDSNGSIPSTQSCYDIPSDHVKQLSLTSPSVLANSALSLATSSIVLDPIGVNVGDLIALTRVNVKVSDLTSALGISLTLSGEIEMYQYKILSTNDVKAPGTGNSSVGVMGLASPWDKSQINKISGIEATANNSLPFITHGGWDQDMNRCLESGVYPWCLSGRPEGSADGTHFTLITQKSTTPDSSGYYTYKQTCFGREGADLGKIFERVFFLNGVSDNWGEGWKRIDDEGLKKEIKTLQSDLSKAETEIKTLQSDLSKAETEINNNKAVIQNLIQLTTKDLSLYDIYGKSIGRTTANCYVIHEPGLYKFPIVYGNSIKNGVTNSSSYTSTSTEMDFVDHKGTKITNPYITSNYNINSYAGCEIILSDVPIDVIGDLQFNDSYISFSINQIPETGGNLIISVKDDDYEYLWSWHIWLWSDDLDAVEITNNDGNKYDILPVNLASKWDDGKYKIKNWFYQWGRPHPMLLPSSYNSTSDHTNYGTEYFSAGEFSDYDDLIRNPHRMTSSTSPLNSYSLWDSSDNSETLSSGDTETKTIYDPCPIGFCVPGSNVFTGFSYTNTVGSFNNGWNFKKNSSDTVGIFFPASGSRTLTSLGTSSFSVGIFGGYWVSDKNSASSGNGLRFTETSFWPSTSDAGEVTRASSIRPVKEK